MREELSKDEEDALELDLVDEDEEFEEDSYDDEEVDER